MSGSTPNSVISTRSMGQSVRSKVRADQHVSSDCESDASKRSGGWGIIVSGRHHDVASVKKCKQNGINDDVFISQSQGDLVYTAHNGPKGQCNAESDTVLRQRRTDKYVSRRTSDRHYHGDMHWAVQSHAAPLKASGTYSFSESARLCQSCGTRYTNSVSFDGSQESLSDECQIRAADIYSTICSVFWKMSITFHPFVLTTHKPFSDFVEFASLWPNSRGLACLLPEICASLQGSIEALCRIAIFADVIKLLNALIDLKIVGKFLVYLSHTAVTCRTLFCGSLVRCLI